MQHVLGSRSASALMLLQSQELKFVRTLIRSPNTNYVIEHKVEQRHCNARLCRIIPGWSFVKVCFAIEFTGWKKKKNIIVQTENQRFSQFCSRRLLWPIDFIPAFAMRKTWLRFLSNGIPHKTERWPGQAINCKTINRFDASVRLVCDVNDEDRLLLRPKLI